jgi:hypothetical protein
LGVPPEGSGVGLSAASPRSLRCVPLVPGYPLQSLTQASLRAAQRNPRPGYPKTGPLYAGATLVVALSLTPTCKVELLQSSERGGRRVATPQSLRFTGGYLHLYRRDRKTDTASQTAGLNVNNPQ